MKKLLLLFFTLFLLPALCFAKEATFVGRSEYIIAVGTGADAEAIALEDAKRLALEQAGTYLESLTIVDNNTVTIDRIKVIARGTARLVPGSIRKRYETIDSSTGAQRLVLTAEFAIDSDEVTAEIARARSGLDLGAVQEKYDAVIEEDQRLQAELLRTTDETERSKLIEQYQQSRNRFFSLQWLLRGIDEFNIVNGTERVPLEKDLKRVMAYFDKGIEIYPKNGENYTMRGVVKFYLLNFNEALSDLNKAVELLLPYQDESLVAAQNIREIILNYMQSQKKAPANQ